MNRCFSQEKKHSSLYVSLQRYTYHIFRLEKRIDYSMGHTLLFPFQYSMFTNNIVTIRPFNDSGVIDVVCPLRFKANHSLLT